MRDRLGRYTVIRKLGAAGMGEVWFAVSPTAEPVALKVIRPHLVERASVRERFAAEVENLKMVCGSRVARLEDADPLRDPAWLAVEYVPGLTLKAYVEEHARCPSMSVRRSTRAARQRWPGCTRPWTSEFATSRRSGRRTSRPGPVWVVPVSEEGLAH